MLNADLIDKQHGEFMQRKESPTTRKPDALRLRRRLVVHVTDHEYERLRQAAACESVSAYIRGLIRQSASALG